MLLDTDMDAEGIQEKFVVVYIIQARKKATLIK